MRPWHLTKSNQNKLETSASAAVKVKVVVGLQRMSKLSSAGESFQYCRQSKNLSSVNGDVDLSYHSMPGSIVLQAMFIFQAGWRSSPKSEHTCARLSLVEQIRSQNSLKISANEENGAQTNL